MNDISLVSSVLDCSVGIELLACNNRGGDGKVKVAPALGFEPRTFRLTGEHSKPLS